MTSLKFRVMSVQAQDLQRVNPETKKQESVASANVALHVVNGPENAAAFASAPSASIVLNGLTLDAAAELKVGKIYSMQLAEA